MNVVTITEARIARQRNAKLKLQGNDPQSGRFLQI